jgi:hypothetical protein
MGQINNSILVEARCRRTKEVFLMRFEQQGEHNWALVARLVRTKAASIPPAQHPRKGSQATQHISGSIRVDPLYRGCPHCEVVGQYSSTFVKCNECARLSCSTPSAQEFTCPWCGNGGAISGTVATLQGFRKTSEAGRPQLPAGEEHQRGESLQLPPPGHQ